MGVKREAMLPLPQNKTTSSPPHLTLDAMEKKSTDKVQCYHNIMFSTTYRDRDI